MFIKNEYVIKTKLKINHQPIPPVSNENKKIFVGGLSAYYIKNDFFFGNFVYLPLTLNMKGIRMY